MGKEKTREIIEKIKEFREKTSKELKIDKIIVFGSLVSGDFGKDSDIDLIVVSDSFRGKKMFKRGIGLHKNWNLDYPVDFICLTPEEFSRKSRQVSIVSQALKDGLVLT